MTSDTSAPATCASRSASLITTAPSWWAGKVLNTPLNPPIVVRTALAMKTLSSMTFLHRQDVHQTDLSTGQAVDVVELEDSEPSRNCQVILARSLAGLEIEIDVDRGYRQRDSRNRGRRPRRNGNRSRRTRRRGPPHLVLHFYQSMLFSAVDFLVDRRPLAAQR